MERRIFGLAGSNRHTIGAQQKSVTGIDKPAINSIMAPFVIGMLAGKYSSEIDINASKQADRFSEHNVARSMEQIARVLGRGTPFPFEFLSKRLLEQSGSAKHILLGSPIYVAYAD